MVVAAFAYSVDQGRRWLVYLTLSVCVNAFLVSLVHFNERLEPIFEVAVLQVNLMTLARPAPPPPLVQAIKQPPPLEPVLRKSIVTTASAAEKIATVPRVSPAPVEPTVAVPVKAIPLPQIKPRTQVVKAKLTPAIEEAKQVVVADIPKKPVVDRKSEAEPAPTPSARSSDVGRDDTTVIHEARYRQQIPPSYPRRALDMGQQGTVTLHAEVLPSGAPRELKIAHSSGYRLLDMAALAAVKKWKFEPTSVNGNAVVSWVRVPVNFVIQ